MTVTLPGAIRAALRRLLQCLRTCYLNRRDRRRLASLDDRLLRDLGMDRPQVEDDSTQAFWRRR